MNTLSELFQSYRASSLYNSSSIEINIEWLKSIIDDEHFTNLESQVTTLLLDNEEEIFIHSFKYAWNLFLELSSNQKQ